MPDHVPQVVQAMLWGFRAAEFVAIAVVAFLLQAPGGASDAAIPPGSQKAWVLYVVDGDTIDVVLDGKRTRIRYIGIDTPELSDERPAVAAMAREATAANKGLVLEREVWLEWDVERTDVYGRALAYVYVEPGVMVNQWLVRQGYAHPFTVPPNVKYAEALIAEARDARAKGRGLWSQAPVFEVTARQALPRDVGPERSVVDLPEVHIQSLSLRDEYVTILNQSDTAVDLTGWTLVSVNGDQTFYFPAGTIIEPKATVTVWSGPRARDDPPAHLRWTGSYIWNNDHDPAVLRDAAGDEVDRYP